MGGDGQRPHQGTRIEPEVRIQNKLRVLGETIYSYGVERFRMVEVGKEKQKGKERRGRLRS